MAVVVSAHPAPCAADRSHHPRPLLSYWHVPPRPLGRLCVVGKAMAEDEAPATNLAWRAGRLDASSDEGGNGGVALGPCVPRTESEAKVGKDGVSRYEIDSETEALLRRYFVPHNAKLFALLGRRLPWAEVEEKPIEELA